MTHDAFRGPGMGVLLLLGGCSEKPLELTVSVTGAQWGRVVSEPAGIDCGERCVAQVRGERVLLRAVPTAEGAFAGWSGDCLGDGVCSLEGVRTAAVGAEFQPRTHTVSVSIRGTGGGFVELPEGARCADSCEMGVFHGQTMRFVAHPDSKSYFASWSAPCSGDGSVCEITVTEDVSAVATVNMKPRLHVDVQGTAIAGSIASEPAGVSCGALCDAWFMPGTTVRLSASLFDEFRQYHRFRGWGDACGGQDACEVVMNGDVTVSATFSPVFVWGREFDGWLALKTAVDANGDIFVAFRSTGSYDMGGGRLYSKTWVFESIFVARYASDGTHRWSKVFGGLPVTAGSGGLGIDGIAPLGSGLVLVGTVSGGSVEFGASTVSAPEGARSAFWVELGPGGTPTSTEVLADRKFWDLAQTSTGDLVGTTATFSTGEPEVAWLGTDSTIDWSIPAPPLSNVASRPIPGPDNSVYMLSNVGGAFEWCGATVTPPVVLRVYPTGACDVAWTPPEADYFGVLGVAAASNGSLIASVSYLGAVNIGAISLPDPPGNLASAFIKFDPDMNPVWARAFWPLLGGSSTLSMGYFSVLTNGDAFVVGGYGGMTDFAPDEPCPSCPFLIQFDGTTGQTEWFDATDPLHPAYWWAISPPLALPDQRVLTVFQLQGSAQVAGAYLSASPRGTFLVVLAP